VDRQAHAKAKAIDVPLKIVAIANVGSRHARKEYMRGSFDRESCADDLLVEQMPHAWH
jgi:hypothetical protein